jgi:hypothetical protein
MIGDDWTFGVRGLVRRLDNIIEDITLDRALFEKYGDHPRIRDCFAPDALGSCAHEYRLANPGTDFEGWADLDGDGILDPVAFTADELGFPAPRRDARAVELVIRKRFSRDWMVHGSYTWSSVQGNYEGPVNSDLGQDDTGVTQSFDTPGLLDHGSGPLPNDRRHAFRLFGTFALDNGFQVGFNSALTSGRPLNGFGLHPDDPWARQYDNTAFFAFGDTSRRGSAGRTDWLFHLDVMLAYAFRSAGLDWGVRLDVFNLTNRHGVIEQNEHAELDNGGANANWLAVTGYQSPRRVRLGVTVEF